MRLLAEGLPAMRLALWSHVNGFFPPQAFISELFEISDRFVFSTKTSITVPIVQKLSEKLKEKLRVIAVAQAYQRALKVFILNPIPSGRIHRYS